MRWLVIAALVVSGCGLDPYRATTTLTYDPVAVLAAPPDAPRLAMLPMIDGRGAREYPSSFGRSFILYIPFVPFSSPRYERLDDSWAITQRERSLPEKPADLFPALMGKAVAADLGRSGIFAFVRPVESVDQVEDADLILSSRLESSYFWNGQTNYGLSIPGIIVFGILPVPNSWQTAEVTLAFTLQDRTGKIVWQQRTSAEAGQVFFSLEGARAQPISSSASLAIVRYGANDYGIDPDSFWAYHAEALRAAMAKAKESMAAAVARRALAGT